MIYKLNDKEYETKEINFRELVKMEKCGVNLTAISDNTFTQAECIISYITGLSKDKVEKEIDEHFENGGTIEEVFKCFNILTESDFFKKVEGKM